MTRDEILEYFKDVNHAYNDCTRYDTLKSMIEELQEPCDDAISRQAAIDACLNGWNKDYKEIVEEIRALPPVTPQYTDAEIQKMQDLESVEIQKAYEIGKAENPNKWIPVSERLPELHEASPLLKKFVNNDSDEVLVTIEDKNNGTRTVSSKCYLWDNLWHGDIFDWLKASKCDFEVTAWMPLPEPYKASPTGAERKDGEQE